MTDRELLELAAKAAALIIVDEDDDLTLYVIDQYDKKNGDEYGERWAPLEDDGDALRLAVTLGLIVDIGLDEHVTAVDYTTPLAEDGFVLEDHFPDRCAATRRAITRAAAEIGRLTL